MITLTPEEAAEYERGGMSAAVLAFRNRTNLGLVESMRAVKQWLETGKNVSRYGAPPSLDSLAAAKLSEALTRARTAEDAFANLRMRVYKVVGDVMNLAKELPEDQQDTWYRACGRVSNELDQKIFNDLRKKP